MFYATKNSLQPLRTSPRSGFFLMLKSFNKNTIKKNKIKKKNDGESQLNVPQRTTFTWSVADLCSSGWNPTQYNTRLSESESPRSGTTHKQVRGALSLHNNTRSWGHLICSGSDPFLCTFLLSRKNANKPVQPLLQYALPHHLPRFAAQCEYLFAQTGLLSIHTSVVAEWSVHTRGVRDFWDCESPAASCRRNRRAACFLPLHVVQVPWYSQSSDGVEFAVVHQAVVSAARHRHPGHQIPVVQQGHVAPHISQHHTGLCATWNIEGCGLLKCLCEHAFALLGK